MSKTIPTTKASTKCVVGPDVLFSYVHVFEPHANMPGQEPKYSIQLRIPKTNTAAIAKMNDSINAALEAAKFSWGGKVPAGVKLPMRDGDVERPEDPTYKNCWFINATSKQKPGVVDGALNAIIDKDEFYSGCFGNASVNFYGYNVNGSKGVSCGLNNIQKIKDGEPMAGRARPDADFSAVDEEFLA